MKATMSTKTPTLTVIGQIQPGNSIVPPGFNLERRGTPRNRGCLSDSNPEPREALPSPLDSKIEGEDEDEFAGGRAEG